MKKFLFILLVVLVISGVAFAGRGQSNGTRWETSENQRGYGRAVATEEQEQYGKGRSYGYQNQEQTCDEFVDEDGDGVCDNCDGEGFGPRWDRAADTGNFKSKFLGSFNETPEINDPVPSQSGNQYGRNEDRAVRGRGTGNQGKGAYCDEFVDEDGDGVCDNCDGEGLAPQDGTGNQNGKNTSGRFSGKSGRGNSRNGKK